MGVLSTVKCVKKMIRSEMETYVRLHKACRCSPAWICLHVYILWSSELKRLNEITTLLGFSWKCCCLKWQQLRGKLGGSVLDGGAQLYAPAVLENVVSDFHLQVCLTFQSLGSLADRQPVESPRVPFPAKNPFIVKVAVFVLSSPQSLCSLLCCC